MSSPLTPIAACRQPQNRHACQLEIRSPGLQVATVTDLVSLAREKRPELVVVDIRIPPTRTTEGLDTARVIHEELSDIGILVLSAHVEIGHAMADRISRVGDFSICVLSPSARSTANGSPTPRIRSPRPIGPLATATTCRSCGPSSPWTQMLDTLISGRIFLEQVIRDNLDIGRPDQVGLVFARRPIRRCPRATPGQFPDQGDHRRGHPEPARGRQTPRSSSKGRPRAPRPPSPTPTISGSGNDRRICPRCGRSATPPTGACSASNESATTRSPGPAALHTVTASVTTATGTRSHALLTALPLFRAQPNGVANKDLRPLIAELRAAPPDTVTYDL